MASGPTPPGYDSIGRTGYALPGGRVIRCAFNRLQLSWGVGIPHRRYISARLQTALKRGHTTRSRPGVWRAGWRLLAIALPLVGTSVPAGAADIPVTAGTLEVTSPATLGSNDVTVDNTADEDATLLVDSGVTVSNVITLNNGGKLDNLGTIARSGSGNHGVTGGYGTVTNEGGGAIDATDATAILFYDGGTVLNTGTGSTISGGFRGIGIQGGPGDVTNNDGAEIDAVDIGIYMDQGGTITNGAGSTISGATAIYGNWSTGWPLTYSITLTNAGTITGTDNIGVDLENGGSIKNIAGGTIAGHNDGVLIWGGDVLNTGSGSAITSVNADGIELLIGGSITNTRGARIEGATNGVVVWDGGTVTNRSGADILGDAGDGVQFNTGGTLVNDGKGSTITGGDGIDVLGGAGDITNERRARISGDTDGVHMESGGTLTNQSGATISGGDVGVVGWGVDIVNSGRGSTISSSTGDGIQTNPGGGSVTNQLGAVIHGGNDGVVIDNSSPLINESGASIIGDNDVGVLSFNGGSVTNAGKGSQITGGGAGVILENAAGTVVNQGGAKISGVDTGVYLDTGGSITNGAGSTISGGWAVYAYGATTLSNAGTLDGWVGLDDTANAVTLFTGSSITGGLLIGANTASTLTLDGAGTELYSHAVWDETDFAGDLIKQGSGTWVLDEDLSAALTTIDAGTLIVGSGGSGSLTGAVTVNADGTLGGSGTIFGNVLVDGKIAPGNSPGTLTIEGTYQQDAGAIYEAQIDPSNIVSDRIDANGTGVLAAGAILNVSRTSTAAYTVGTRYTVLNAAGGLTGTFTLTGDITPSAFLSLTDHYDNDNAYLDVEQSHSLVEAAGTPNQVSVANVLQALPTDNGLFTALLNLPTDAAASDAFDKISGDIHASIRSALLDDASSARTAAVDRLRDAFCPSDVSAAADPAGSPVRAPGCPDTRDVWGSTFGSWGHNDGNGNAAGLDHSTGGILIGTDMPVGDAWRVGVLGGYGQSQFGGPSASASSDDYDVGLYGGARWSNLSLRLGAAYTWHAISTVRDVTFSGFSDHPQANYNAGIAQSFAEVGYRLPVATDIEPFANIGLESLRTDAFTETSGAAALSSTSVGDNVAVGTLGVHLFRPVAFGALHGGLKMTAAWQHTLGDVTPTSAFSLAGSDPFSVSGLPLASDAAEIRGEFDVSLTRGATFGLAYGGQFASGSIDQNVSGNLGSRF